VADSEAGLRSDAEKSPTHRRMVLKFVSESRHRKTWRFIGKRFSSGSSMGELPPAIHSEPYNNLLSRSANSISISQPGPRSRGLQSPKRPGIWSMHVTAPIQYSADLETGWTRRPHLVTIRAMPREFRINKLSDEFGLYSLLIECRACGHKRTTEPHLLGKLCGWDARLEEVAKRMRCSKCGKKDCRLSAVPPPRNPRGYSALSR
jgi:hypothetical protein